ncbi:MAG: class I SAM-dependent methyltransferase [Balneolaceae bacterium]|nr:MAG: class I SAM-dependent methyltransferase [Balneolaceae bacterium]
MIEKNVFYYYKTDTGGNVMQEFWNQRYSLYDYGYGIKPNKFFKSQIDRLSPGKLLLPGEGEGRNAVYAAKRGWEVTAVDFSVKAQIKANRLAVDHNVEIQYIVDNLENAVIPEDTYNAAALIYVQLDSKLFETVMQKVLKSLKKGGTFFMECYSEKQLGRRSGGPKSLNRLYTIPQIQKLLDDLNITYLQEEEIMLQEGEFHQGKAMVIRGVAIR